MFDYKKLYDIVQSLKVVQKTMTEKTHYVIESNDLRLTSMDKELDDLKRLLEQLDSGELRLVEANEVGYVNNGVESMETVPTATSNISTVETDPFMSKMKGFISQWEASSENEDFFAALEELLTIDPEGVAAQTKRIFALETQVGKLDTKLKDMPMNNTSSYNNQADWMEKINNLTKRLVSLEAEYASLADRLRSQSTANFGSTSDFDKGIKEIQSTKAEMNKDKAFSLDKCAEDLPCYSKTASEQPKPQPSFKPYLNESQEKKITTPEIKPAQTYTQFSKPVTNSNVVPSVEEPKQMTNNYSSFSQQEAKGFNTLENNLDDKEQSLINTFNSSSSIVRLGRSGIALVLQSDDADIRAERKVPYTSLEAAKEVPLIMTDGEAMYYGFEISKKGNTFYVIPTIQRYTVARIQNTGLEEFFDIRGEIRPSINLILDAPAIFKKVEDNFVIERRGIITVL